MTTRSVRLRTSCIIAPGLLAMAYPFAAVAQQQAPASTPNACRLEAVTHEEGRRVNLTLTARF